MNYVEVQLNMIPDINHMVPEEQANTHVNPTENITRSNTHENGKRKMFKCFKS